MSVPNTAAIDSISQDAQIRQATLLTVVQFCGGAFMWLAVGRVPYDFACLRGRRGSLWGAFMLYFPCRYLSIISVWCEMIHSCAFPRNFAVTLGKAALVLRLVSITLAFVIFLLRVNTLWRNGIVWTFTTLSQLVLWGAICYEMSMFGLNKAYTKNAHITIASALLYLSTVVFIFYLLAIVGRGPTRPATAAVMGSKTSVLFVLVNQVYRGDAVGLAIFWLSSATGSAVLLALRHWDPNSRRALCFSAWLVIVHTACQQYERLAEQGELFLVPKISFGWFPRSNSALRNVSPARRERGTPAAGESPEYSCSGPKRHSRSHSISLRPRMDGDIAIAEGVFEQKDSKNGVLLTRRLFIHGLDGGSDPNTAGSSRGTTSPEHSTGRETITTSAVTATTPSEMISSAMTSTAAQSFSCESHH